MPDMFGAPIGISAAEDQINQNVLTGLKAQQALGAIAKQPAEQALAEAHARLYSAEAAKAESQAADLKRMQDVEAEVTARRQGSAIAAAQGQLLTVDNLPPGGRITTRSAADPIDEFLAAAEGKGIPPRLLLPYYEKSTTIRQHEAAAANSAANQQKNQLAALKEKATLIGQYASTALANPQNYGQLLLSAPPGLLPTEHLTGVFETDAPVLRALNDASLTTKEKIDAQEKATENEAHRKLWKSAEAKNSAAIRVADARYNLINERYLAAKKNGGEASPEVKALREERALAWRARREAADRKEFPPAPLDPKLREVGKQYTAANGAKFLWTKDPNTGNPVAVLLAPPPGSKAAAAVASEAARTAKPAAPEAESAAEDATETEEE